MRKILVSFVLGSSIAAIAASPVTSESCEREDAEMLVWLTQQRDDNLKYSDEWHKGELVETQRRLDQAKDNLAPGVCTEVLASTARLNAQLEVTTRDAAKKAEAEARRQALLPGARIGMSKKQVIERTSWGKPRDVSRTITARGVHEQWVYGNGSYLYFDNGVLTAIQD